jgi:Acyl-CoA reductase (LuxC)
VIGGEEGEGSVIVSQLSDPIDFTSLLADRTVNIVPVDTLDEVLPRFDFYTQTIGIYPEELRTRLRDVAPLFGVQRFVPLGYSSHHTWCGPHDSLELDRRMCKWIVSLEREPIPLALATSGDAKARVKPEHTPATLEAVRAAESDGSA